MKIIKILQVFACMCITMLLALGLMGCNYKEENKDFSDVSIDIETAYSIASSEAIKWNLNAKPYFASSTDCDYSDILQGIDGTRKAWTFTFVIENPDTCFNIFINNGAIDHTQEVASAFNHDLILPVSELKINSKEAVSIAKNKYGLLPSENWAVGYHFSLKNINNELCITVNGMNSRKERMSVAVNEIIEISSEPTEMLQTVVQSASPKTNYQHYVVDQNATAYLSGPGAKTASGKTVAIGMVAVHPRKYSSNSATAVASGPVIPFGTVITINQDMSFLKYVTLPGSSKQWTQFIVEDLGQLNHQQGYSPWWADIYFGIDNATNRAAAMAFGNNKTMAYTYWAPIDIF